MANLMTLPPQVPSGKGGSSPRVDGPLKVTGGAMYASDHNLPGMLYAVPVCATIASGTITGLDTSAAERMPGVKAVFYHSKEGQKGNVGQLFRCAPGGG